MTPFLNGLGIVAATGRGVDALRSPLQAGWHPPTTVALPDGRELPVYPLPPGALEDKSFGRKVRRADRLTKMAVLSAADALGDAGLPSTLDRRRIGLVVATAFGSHATTFEFLDEILTYGDAAVSPTVFSHSVQNAAAAYVASVLDIQGPVMTLTQVHFAFHHALVLARQWLIAGQCDHVLVGGADELGSVMQFICRSILRVPADGRLRPFAFAKDPVAIPGEGSAFFLLSSTPQSGAYAKAELVEIAPWGPPAMRPDLHLLEADGTLADESGYRIPAASGVRLAACAPVFGSMPGGTALHLAAAALMLKEQFVSPLTGDAPDDLATAPQSLESVHLTRLHCNGAAGHIQLTNPN
jgi:hypothetical protein